MGRISSWKVRKDFFFPKWIFGKSRNVRIWIKYLDNSRILTCKEGTIAILMNVYKKSSSNVLEFVYVVLNVLRVVFP